MKRNDIQRAAEGITKAFYESIPARTAEKWSKGFYTIDEATTEAARAYILQNLSNYEKYHLEEAAQRIINLDTYEARNETETPYTITAAIIDQPHKVINYLLDIIEELQQ